MANPVCSATTLVTNAAPYNAQHINAEQQKCLLIYGKVLELKGIGGTDYSAVMTTTLMQDAATLEIGFNEDDITAAEINLQFLKATAAGGTVPSGINAQLLALGKLVNADPLMLDLILLLLDCKLGVHKGYPQ